MLFGLIKDRSVSNSADPRLREDRVNAPTMDSRKQKRHASRSPDGVPHRKQTRSDTLDDNASRRSSASTGTSRHLDLTSPHAHERRSSVHGGVDLRSKGANSPNSRSGGHTPMQNVREVQPLVTAPNTASLTSESTKPIFDALMQFSSRSAKYAILQYRKDEAAASLKRVNEEYEANQPHYNSFPAMKDRKTAARDAAQKEFTTIESLLKANEQEQHNHIQTLARLIENAAAYKEPAIVKEDFASAEAFNELKSRHEELERGQNIMTASVKALQIDMKEGKDKGKDINQKLQDASQEQETIKEDVKVATERQNEMERKLSGLSTVAGDLPDLRNSVKKCAERITESDSKVEKLEQLLEKVRVLESNNTDLMAWKEEIIRPALDDIKSRLTDAEKQRQKVEVALTRLQASQVQISGQGVSAKSSSAKLEALQLSLNETEESTKKILQDVKDLKNSHNGLIERQDTFDQKLGGMKKDINKKINPFTPVDADKSGAYPVLSEFGDEDFKKTIQVLLAQGPELISKINKLGRDLEEMVDKIDGKVDGSIGLVSRINKVEDHIRKIDLRSASQPSGHSPDAEDGSRKSHAAAEFEDLKDDIEQLWTSLKELPAIVNTEVQNMVTGLQDGLKSLNEASASRAGEVDKIRAELEAKLSDLRVTIITAFQTKVDASNEFKSMKRELGNEVDQKLQSLTEQVTALRQLQAQSIGLPQPDQPQQQQHMARQSPRMPNGRTASPLVNGGPVPPGHTHGHQSPMVPPSVPQQQQQMHQQPPPDPHQLQMRMDQVTLVLDQLKRRYDNLTTDEMVRLMLKQFEAIWPHAGKYEATCNGLWSAIRETNNWLRGLQEKLAVVQNVQASSRSSTNDTAELKHSSEVTAGLKDLEKAVVEVKTLCQQHEQLLEQVGVEQMGVEVKEIEAALSKHDLQVNGTATAVGTLQGIVKSVQERLATLSGQVEGIMEVVSGLT